MDNIREKLVELLEESRISCGENGVRINGSRDIADHLLANGVTVQEWIPASEPPETNGCYLVAGNLRWDGKPMAREAYWSGDDWLSCDGKCNITRRITRWMPLPSLPKGE